MNCSQCHGKTRKYGKDKLGNQRFYCDACKRAFIAEKKEIRLEKEKIVLCIKLLVEGCSVRSAERISGVHRDTILHLVTYFGARCEQVMGEKIQNIPLELVEADEVWGYVGCKQGMVEKGAISEPTFGDAYTFCGIEAKTKLVVCYALGKRDLATATKFMERLHRAASSRFQLTTDGLKAYLGAVETVFGSGIDYAMLVKKYKSDNAGSFERRYSPGDFIEAKKTLIMGNPRHDKISTSYVERQNLTMRMSMRRLTRLTNGFSKKFANLEKSLAIHFAFYNFCRVHKSLRITPAMAAGITGHVWSIEELLGL